MALYAIGDLHLSLGCDKPMDVFGGRWTNYVDKLLEGFSQLRDEDLTVLCGDLSWGMSLEGARDDFLFIDRLPGRKVVLKGNHDYWWSTATKARRFFAENGIDTIDILYNNCCLYGETALCGTRGWPFDDLAAQGEKLMAREAGRLRMSLQAAGDAAQRIAFLHYPPIYPGAAAQELVDVLHDFGVTECYYGHLHGKSIRYATQGERDGITYRLISADGLAFCPYKIR